jgi:branched-chain amino acid transport system permease protein
MGILNLSHGAFYMIGAFIGLAVMKETGNFLIAILAGGILVTAIGFILERGFLSHLYRKMFDQALLCFGFIYVFMNLRYGFLGHSIKAALYQNFSRVG